jgi:hypothetical protein
MCYKHICTDVSLIILAYMSILYFAAFFTSMKIENTHRTSSTKEAIVGVYLEQGERVKRGARVYEQIGVSYWIQWASATRR